jgi:hypothetical protein
MEDEFYLGKLDYDITDGLDERKNGRYKFTADFHRLKLFTERIQEYLEEKTGKKVPLLSVIELTKEESDEVRMLISEAAKFSGLYGAYRVKAFDTLKVGKIEKDCLITEEELHYDYKWSEL